MTDIFIDLLGWAGAALVLASYILLSNGRLQGQSAVYQWMNVGGAMGLLINCAWNGAIPSVALNVIWLAMGLFTLWRTRTVS
jgi:hypothetical protein